MIRRVLDALWGSAEWLVDSMGRGWWIISPLLVPLLAVVLVGEFMAPIFSWGETTNARR